MNEDWLSSVRLHHENVDWSDLSLTPASLTKRFMGPCGYLRGLDQQQSAKKEIEILKKADVRRLAGSSEYKPYYQHFLTLIKLLMPRRDITPNLADSIMFFHLARQYNRKAVNYIGAQNTGKSSALSIIPTICIAINHINSVGYVATPHDKASDSTLWGDTLSAYHAVQDSSPWLWPNGKPYAARNIVMVPGTPKAGFIEYRGIKEVGKYKGMKTVKVDDADPLLLTGLDEFNEVKNHSFLEGAFPNLVSQDGFMALTSQNFTNEENMGGALAAPFGLFPDNPRSYDDLNKDEHFFWHSVLDGLTLRFDGRFSPNILAGRTIYKYLFKQEELDYQTKHYGVDSAKYYSQVLSFPRTGLSDETILSRSRVNSSRYKDVEWISEREDSRHAHLDPSFGGGDKAMIGFGHVGRITATTADGSQQERIDALWFTQPMVSFKTSLDAKVTLDWMERMRALGTDLKHFTLGTDFSLEHQLAVLSGEYCKKYSIPLRNFSYDFSMRAGIVSAMRDVLGRDPMPFEYNGKPDDLWIETHKNQSSEVCYDRNTELAMLTADLFLQKQIRGGQYIETAITQLCRTKRELAGKKYKAERKIDYKARHAGHSPDERDCLLGIVGNAHKRGFRPKPIALKPPPGSGKTVKKNPFLTSRRPAFLK